MQGLCAVGVEGVQVHAEQVLKLRQRVSGGSVGRHPHGQYDREGREQRVFPLIPGLAQQLRSKGGVPFLRCVSRYQLRDVYIPVDLPEMLRVSACGGAASQKRTAKEQRQKVLFHIHTLHPYERSSTSLFSPPAGGK